MMNRGSAAKCTTCNSEKPKAAAGGGGAGTGAGGASGEPTEADIAYMTNMGATREWAIKALKESVCRAVLLVLLA